MTPDEIRDQGDEGCPEDALRDAQLRSLGLMLAGFAHELNSPLGVIASTCDSLRRCHEKLAEIAAHDELTATDLQNLRKVLRIAEAGQPVLDMGIERAQALVRELRLAARPDQELPAEPVALVDVIEGDLLLLGPMLPDGLTIVRAFDARPVIKARPALLGQVFFNLLRNAVQALGGPGEIAIRVTADDARAVVVVADDGPGFPDDVLARLFREEVTTKCPETGTGLGLFMSQKVLTKFGGTITAANRPEGGAMLTVTLPLA